MADQSEPAEVVALFDEQPKPAPLKAVGTERGAFKVSEEGIKWKCSVCDQENALDLQYCAVCGVAFAEAVKPKQEPRPQRDAGTAALFSLFMPGAGHAYLGLWPQAVTRAVVSLWVLLVVVAGLIQGDIPGSGLLAAVFGLASFILWAVSAHDAYREARGETRQVLLKGRMYLYVVLGLLALLFILLLFSGLTARS